MKDSALPPAKLCVSNQTLVPNRDVTYVSRLKCYVQLTGDVYRFHSGSLPTSCSLYVITHSMFFFTYFSTYLSDITWSMAQVRVIIMLHQYEWRDFVFRDRIPTLRCKFILEVRVRFLKFKQCVHVAALRTHNFIYSSASPARLAQYLDNSQLLFSSLIPALMSLAVALGKY